MTVPATKGQLRTKVKDMAVGDYIPLRIDIVSASDIRFAFNDTSVQEIAFTGLPLVAGNKGFLYLVKITKGMLLADRVGIYNISWDQMNRTSLKLVQGVGWDSGTLIPKMTSNTSPSGEASASSIFGASYQPFNAFNRVDDAEGWCSANGTTTGWVAYDFMTPTTISAYGIKSMGNYITQMPRNFTLEGFNTSKGTWEVIDTQVNQTGWGTYERRRYALDKEVTYPKYRLNISADNGKGNYVGVNEFELYGQAGVFRSLTGGVAYADVNGGMTTTDLENGSWPTVNEWDRYVVNFSNTLIQTGKAIDDVFHWSSAWTWCQDTPLYGVRGATISHRVCRGYSGLNDMGLGMASGTMTTLGFRPVFEYKEV